MSTETLTLPEYDAGAAVYFRLYNETGQVFDFDDNTFKTIGAATTPQASCTERTEMGGTGKSGYTVSVDFANVNDTGSVGRYIVKAFLQAGGSPAATDAAISDGLSLTVQFGSLGEKDIIAQAEISVKSTAGSTCQISAWLEHAASRISVSSNGGVVFTAAVSDTITSNGHNLSDDDVVILTTSNTLPAGLSTGTPYYVINSTANTFELSATQGGGAVDITDTGTGTHRFHNPTATVTLREHGSGSNLFSKSFTAADLIQSSTVTDVFEAEQSSPNFTDDRQYSMVVSITENGVTHTTQHNRPVVG